jgi:hypothetical protein
MTPDQLTNAARNLAHGLGIPIYIRDGQIYQHGPGLMFLPPSATHPAAVEAPSHEEKGADEAE